jgi:hypothetical protein
MAGSTPYVLHTFNMIVFFNYTTVAIDTTYDVPLGP